MTPLKRFNMFYCYILIVRIFCICSKRSINTHKTVLRDLHVCGTDDRNLLNCCRSMHSLNKGGVYIEIILFK